MKTKPKTYWIAKSPNGDFNISSLMRTKKETEFINSFWSPTKLSKKQGWEIMKVKLVEVK